MVNTLGSTWGILNKTPTPANTSAAPQIIWLIDLFLPMMVQLFEGSGIFYGKMPGCCLPSLTAATALHFTAGYLKQ
jgi:hypothetical protein